ncbi:hypothetical protein [Methylophilus sp. 3sh_L]|uniref:hypothetical protein n=1 Tax=Methylophilus sp. 3sh_L TaxID=3377114 RepID=UPI00398E8645
MSRLSLCVLLIALLPAAAFAAKEEADDIQAKTANGDEVVLHSNGYWEFKDAKKAEEAKVKVEQFERSNSCPLGMRPSFLGIGRCIAFDDPILKRGSLSGKGR